MILKNEYQEVLRKLNKLPVEKCNGILAEITENQMTFELEDAVLNIRSISGVGPVTAREILFAIGINLE